MRYTPAPFVMVCAMISAAQAAPIPPASRRDASTRPHAQELMTSSSAQTEGKGTVELLAEAFGQHASELAPRSPGFGSIEDMLRMMRSGMKTGQQPQPSDGSRLRRKPAKGVAKSPKEVELAEFNPVHSSGPPARLESFKKAYAKWEEDKSQKRLEEQQKIATLENPKNPPHTPIELAAKIMAQDAPAMWTQLRKNYNLPPDSGNDYWQRVADAEAIARKEGLTKYNGGLTPQQEAQLIAQQDALLNQAN